MSRLGAIDNEVWCTVHGCIHEKSEDPYNQQFGAAGLEPDCTYKDWLKLWIGAPVKKKDAVP